MKRRGKNEPKVERIVQFVDDPKNSDALARIHEMSTKAKNKGKSPTQVHRVRFMGQEPDDKNKEQPKETFNRRRQHFATVKSNKINLNIKDSDKNVGNTGKKEYVWDKKINRLVEKDSSEIKKPDVYQNRIEKKYQTKTEPIKEDQKTEEKVEIIEKLKEYKKKNDDGKKKRIAINVPKANGKYSNIVYEKKMVKDGEEDFDDDDDDWEKNFPGAKNAKVYRKIVKNEPGQKVVITKKVIEESSEQKNDNLHFDNDSSDEEDIKKELRKLRINPSDMTKGNVKVKVITEEYDENGNKIYSKEVTTNKLPKGLKGNDEIMDEFERFEEEFYE